MLLVFFARPNLARVVFLRTRQRFGHVAVCSPLVYNLLIHGYV